MDEENVSLDWLTPDNFEEFYSKLQGTALRLTRNAAALPSDINFHRSMDSGFSQGLDTFSSRVLSLTSDILGLVTLADAGGPKKLHKLAGLDDIVDHFHPLLVDPVDRLLEHADICLDEFSGSSLPIAIAVNPTKVARKAHNTFPVPVIQHASHIPKPQLLFKNKIDNSEAPWYPTLHHKYHARVPLGHQVYDSEQDSPMTNHPYHYEVTHLAYPEWLYHTLPPASPNPFSSTPFTWVSTIPEFQNMLTKLRRAKEVAVDLEYHSYRSYVGFVCLMQVSTREEDWIVDTLVLREEMEELGEVFADPGIVKVFHGAESDIIWLQQDFNLYVVNLFDTFHASKVLGFPRHGLANLLEMYCDFSPDKRYQLADWRIRPLPREMLQYARSDTHFLLYIYDNLRNALLDRGVSSAGSSSPSGSTTPPYPHHVLVNQVLSRSAETSLRTYEREVYDGAGGSGSNGWDTLAKKWNKNYLVANGGLAGAGALQNKAYRAIHSWRDCVARAEDESIRFILPNHYLFQLVENPPGDITALLGIFGRNVPPIIRKRARELLDALGNALGQPNQTITNTATGMAELEAEVGPKELDSEDTITLASGSGLVSSNPTLFSPAQPLQSVSRSMSASTSALFGDVKAMVAGKPQKNDSSFRELVSRINRTLVIIPSVPQVASTKVPPINEMNAPDTAGHDAAPGIMQIEIPYVPASQRQSNRANVDDTIVVVGQVRPKKRKRVKDTPHMLEPAASADGTQSQVQEEGTAAQPEFDFSAVPNILDNDPDIDDGKKKRQKKQKKSKGGMFYGDFRAPPKAHSELKSGNQSHTFK